MSFPTILGPWYVVQRLNHGNEDHDNINAVEDPFIEYYTSLEEGTTTFQRDKKRALIFMSLAAASRVASAETAEVRVLTTKEEAEEFGRGR